MPKPFSTNPDENAGKMKGQDYKSSLEGGEMGPGGSETTGPNTPLDKAAGTPKPDAHRKIGS